MNKTFFGLGCFPHIDLDEETMKELEKEAIRSALQILKEKDAKEKEKESAKPEGPEEEDDSDTHIYNVIHDGDIYYVRGDRFEYSDDGEILSIFKGDMRVAVFTAYPAIIDDSCYIGSKQDYE